LPPEKTIDELICQHFVVAFLGRLWQLSFMPLPPTWDLFGQDHLPHRLQLLSKMIDRQTARQLQQEFGISLAEWRVLAFICSAGPATAAQIGNASAIDRAEVSRAVARLEDAALIDRRTDPAHRKRMILEPSATGRELFGRIRDRRRAYFDTIMSGIPPETRSTVDAALRTMAVRLLDEQREMD
jgi:DNA-binding MarR family transcriptional regulator